MRRRLAVSILILLSLGSIVLSLGAPGLGWVLSGVTLIDASMCSALIGRRWLLVCMGLTVALLLTFGPLGHYKSSALDSNWVMAAFTFGPLAIGLAAFLVPLFKQKRERTDR